MLEVGVRAADALRRSDLACEGVNLWLSDGEAAGQEIPHVHLHVLPRFDGDGFRLVKEGGWASPQPRHVLDSAAERIRGVWS